MIFLSLRRTSSESLTVVGKITATLTALEKLPSLIHNDALILLSGSPAEEVEEVRQVLHHRKISQNKPEAEVASV